MYEQVDLKKKRKKKIHITLLIISMLFCIIWIWLYNEFFIIAEDKISKTRLTKTRNQISKSTEILVIFDNKYINLNSASWIEKSRVFWEKYNLKYSWSFKGQNMVSFDYSMKSWIDLDDFIEKIKNLEEVKFVQKNISYNSR